MTDAEAWAARLASGDPIDDPVALIVAHPDDETLWAGAALHRLRSLTLIMLTDGAPDDMGDAHRNGCMTRDDYAALRARELAAALAALGARPRLIRYNYRDQTLVHHLPTLIQRLRVDLAGMAAVMTHPYEGGHPDHDAAALVVGQATAAPIVEFACYALIGGERVFGRFVPGPQEHSRPLSLADAARVDTALRAHASQAHVFGDWRPDAERWRAATACDFSRPPPGEGVLYDGFGWSMTSLRWRELAAATLVTGAL